MNSVLVRGRGFLVLPSTVSPEFPNIHSIAVLPLKNLSGDIQQDYLADGITELLTAELSKTLRIRVTSRTSAMQYRNTDKPLPVIARELNVDAVLEGSVVRSGNRLRVTAQLVQGAVGSASLG